MEVQGKFFRNCREHQWISKNICMRVEKRNLVRFSTRERAWMGPTPYWHSLPQSKLFPPPPLSFIFFPPDRSTAMLTWLKVMTHGADALQLVEAAQGGVSCYGVGELRALCPPVNRERLRVRQALPAGKRRRPPGSSAGPNQRRWRARERRTPASFVQLMEHMLY